MSENTRSSSKSKYVVLIAWADGRRESLEIPSDPWPGRSCPLLEVGPRNEEPLATVPLYANGEAMLAEVIVHGNEIPSMLVCPAPAAQPTRPPELTVKAALAAPSTCLPGYPGALDVQVAIVDGAFAATGEVTMVPDKSDRDWRGGFCPYGTEPGMWVDGHLRARLREHYGEGLREVLAAIAGTAAECCAQAAQETRETECREALDAARIPPAPPTETDVAPCVRCDSEPPCASCPELATLLPDDSKRVPEWLAEAMSEAGQRHDLRSVEGNENAMHSAARMSDDYGLKCRSCASLARGYRSCASALAAAKDGDENASASHNEAASMHFREALELARKAEELAA